MLGPDLPVARVCLVTCALLLNTAALSTSAFAQSSALPPPWLDQDIGGPAIAGSAAMSGTTVTVDASGGDIWSTADQFHFVYQPVHGDVDVRARVDSLTCAASWSKAGVMIRSGLSADAANVYALVSCAKGSAVQHRAQAGTSTTSTPGPFVAPPEWVRLLRTGTTIYSYVSTDGVSWVLVAEDSVALATDVYVGFAVTSHNQSALVRASGSSFAVTPLALPAQQRHADIGAPAVAGTAFYSNGTYMVAGAGADIWGAADQFQYVYQPITGDADISVHVTSILYTDAWAKGGVMIRESLAPGARHASAFMSAARGYAFQRRPVAGGTSVNTSGGSGVAPGWVRLTRTGDVFTAYRSADGQNWSVIGSDSIPMGAAVYAGIAVTSHNVATATAVLADTFKSTATAPPTNSPPTVAITAPTAGSTFAAPASITISATASDPENQLARVEFYSGTTLLGTRTVAPYTITWSSVPTGTYALTARAYDAANATASSSAVSVTVSAVVSPPTGIAFTGSTPASTVTSYRLDVFTAVADPSTATPVATLNLGNPAPDATGTITVSAPSFFSALPVGSYLATVTAIGSVGSSRSAPLAFAR